VGGARKKKQIVGYRYYMGMHLALCQGPVDAVTALAMQERTFWTGSSAGGSLAVDQPELFGGDKREGGISGTIDVLMGGASQTANDYLQSAMAGGGPTPAFRGVLSLVLRRMYLAANNPYIKPISARVKRLQAGWDPAAPSPWSGTELAAGNGMNPAAIIYQCLTDTRWGMGYSPSMLDGFTQAAYQLGLENFGLNLAWMRQQTIEVFVQGILDYVMGVLAVAPDGRLKLRLIRPADAVQARYGPHNVVALESFERPGWGETVNELTVGYTDHGSGQPATIVVQNLANMHAQGGLVAARREYPGITDPDLAATVALRDLAIASTPLARVKLRVDGRAMELGVPGGGGGREGGHGGGGGGLPALEPYFPTPGDLISWTWPDLGIENLLLRIGEVEFSPSGDHTLRLTCLEDVFRATEGVIVSPSAVGWSAPSASALAPVFSHAVEVAYWDLARSIGRAELAYTETDDTYISAVAVRADAMQLDWKLWTGASVGSAQAADLGGYAGAARAADAIAQSATDTVVVLTDSVDLATLADAEYAWIVGADGSPRECVGVAAINVNTPSVTLVRGVLDTVPIAHSAGVWIVGHGPVVGVDDTIRAPSESIGVWVQPTTPADAGALAPVTGGPMIVLTGRQGLPYPPGNVKLNTVSYPAAILGALAVTWAHRDRIQQTAYLVRQDEGDIGPEAGVTYRIRYYGETDVLLRTRTGLTGTADTWSEEAADSALPGGRLNGRCRVRLDAQRGGFDSWRPQDVLVDRAGYGYNWGQYYGGI
jgi:hypothetical protein